MPAKLNFSDKRTLEKYSSAISLSDMEIFVFPELFFPLVISNIMSPIIWTWRDNPWFKDIHKKSFTYKVNRIKQFIMDHYAFNLDLETWGLTEKEVEMDRFRDFVDMNILRQSNALFGYEGDKYYFDLDIRQHFGLDKYTTNIIPYWKTETVEAMTAFRHKPGFTTGAGECVSFSALYAAALFIVGRIPLEKIFLIATPLHSQNFIDVDEGVITNNRRIVTKTMWFNGTPITSKARRALENENVTIVSHISGYIHHVYKKATIDPAAYNQFADSLERYLKSELNVQILLNFLRNNGDFAKYFQYKYHLNSKDVYIPVEKIFSYEQTLKQVFSKQTEEAFLTKIEVEETNRLPLEGRIVFQDIEKYLEQKPESAGAFNHITELARKINIDDPDSFLAYIDKLKTFIEIEPRLPQTDKQFVSTDNLEISINQSREEIIQSIQDKAAVNEVANLALYTYRQMDKIDWRPFLKAAMERNPVSLKGLQDVEEDEVYQMLLQMPNESIYDSQRLAQPDEVWNFQRGDGVEKAILLANYLCNESKQTNLRLLIENNIVILKADNKSYRFFSNKGLQKQLDCSSIRMDCLCKCC